MDLCGEDQDAGVGGEGRRAELCGLCGAEADQDTGAAHSLSKLGEGGASRVWATLHNLYARKYQHAGGYRVFAELKLLSPSPERSSSYPHLTGAPQAGAALHARAHPLHLQQAQHPRG